MRSAGSGSTGPISATPSTWPWPTPSPPRWTTPGGSPACWSCTRSRRASSRPARTSPSCASGTPTRPCWRSTRACSRSWRRTAGRPSPWWTVPRSAAAASWPWPATSGSAPARPCSPSPSWRSASWPARAATGGWPRPSASRPPAACCTPGPGSRPPTPCAAGLLDDLAEDPEAAARALAERIGRQSWRALELTKLALRSHRPATTAFDSVGQALLFGSQDKYDRMDAFLNRRRDLGTGAPGRALASAGLRRRRQPGCATGSRAPPGAPSSPGAT